MSLVERLREYAGWAQYDWLADLLREAADRIEQAEREPDEEHQAWSECNERLGRALNERDEALRHLEAVLQGLPPAIRAARAFLDRIHGAAAPSADKIDALLDAAEPPRASEPPK